MLALSPAARAEFVDGKTLLGWLNGTQEEQATASGYARGAFDASYKATHCAPSGVTLTLLMEYTRWMLENNPSKLEQSADRFIGAGLARKWPCKGENCDCQGEPPLQPQRGSI